ncbi:SixA phosphatase family protein [Faunimonas sp. B44]|uniref:SixA phosphatase family protein n=1 Tax=Faunimonas sp. B44 TaxID=3461493 RepID=UPI004044E793
MLLRHAKSDRPSGTADIDRPLSERGRRDAAAIGRVMAERGLQPETVICSPSARTRETLDLVLPRLAPVDDVRFVNELYEADEATLLALVKLEGKEAGALLVIGHNPSIEQAALALAGSSGPDADRDAMAGKYPTAALAVLDFDGPWSDLRPGAAVLRAFIRPRDLAGHGTL